MKPRYFALAILFTAACGDDGSVTPADAPAGSDMATASNIETVTCASGELVVMATTGMYVPAATTIAVDGVVKFTMPATHNVVPNVGGDVNLKVNFNETKCLKFKAAGSYTFRCGPHNFMGTITVN